MKRVSLKGVAIGSITDILSTNVVLFPVQIYVVISSGLNLDHDARSIPGILKASTVFFASSSILGSL